MIFKENLLEIYQDYTHFIIDIWGVIHDGSHVYPGVIENLRKVRESGKKYASYLMPQGGRLRLKCY